MHKFKIGDTVVCVTGFSKNTKSTDSDYPGFGYEEGKVFVIHRITEDNLGRGPIVWAQTGSGIYEIAVKLVQKREFKKLKLDL